MIWFLVGAVLALGSTCCILVIMFILLHERLSEVEYRCGLRLRPPTMKPRKAWLK